MTAREDGGGTPLHIAALDAQAGTAELLVDAGVNPTAQYANPTTSNMKTLQLNLKTLNMKTLQLNMENQ